LLLLWRQLGSQLQYLFIGKGDAGSLSEFHCVRLERPYFKDILNSVIPCSPSTHPRMFPITPAALRSVALPSASTTPFPKTQRPDQSRGVVQRKRCSPQGSFTKRCCQRSLPRSRRRA
jgi:hypothetical protein